MVRFLLTLGVLLLLALGLAAAAGVLAYGTEAPRDGTLDVAGLTTPVTLAWDENRTVWIEGDDDAAVAAGLGYAHAADHGWAASLWRQAARGRLAEWFGPEMRSLDLHARTLGFDGLARRSYEVLDDGDRAVLDAYALGATAGFAEPGVAQSDAFIVADVVPTGWKPWDPLAVERLHAYLASPALTADSTWRRAAAGDSSVAAFVRADSLFRDFLGFPGGGYDRVYALDGGDRTLVQQTSAGASALEFLAPVVLKIGGRTTLALTIPGSLTTPSGWSDGTGWGMLMDSDVRLEPYAGAAPPPVFSRIVDRDGDETLLSVTRDTSGLVLRAGRAPLPADTASVADSTDAQPTPAPPSSVRVTTAQASTAPALSAAVDSTETASGWRIRWSGFALGSDVGAFRSLWAGRIPARFEVLSGNGLAVTTGATRLLGAPAIRSSADGVAFVASDSLARYAARALQASTAPDSTVADSSFQLLEATDRDLTSAWAREQLPGLMAGLGKRDSLADVLQGPYAYLKSWDGAYRADGIAPSLFEWWLASHRDLTGHLPDPADSLDVALLPSSLRIARAELRDRYGPLPTDWRWGRLQGGATYAVLSGRGSAAARRFREELPSAGGHPTAPIAGPSVVFDEESPGVAVWSLRTRLSDGRMEIHYPGNRPPPSGVLEIDPRAESAVWVITPSAPLPSARLRLLPSS